MRGTDILPRKRLLLRKPLSYSPREGHGYPLKESAAKMKAIRVTVPVRGTDILKYSSILLIIAESYSPREGHGYPLNVVNEDQGTETLQSP